MDISLAGLSIKRFRAAFFGFGSRETFVVSQQTNRMFSVITKGGTEFIENPKFFVSVGLPVA